MAYKEELEVRLRRAENVLDRAKKRVKKWRRKLIRARAAHLYARQEVRRIRRELEAELASINAISESAPSSPTPSCEEPTDCKGSEPCPGCAEANAFAEDAGFYGHDPLCEKCLGAHE